MHLQVGEGENWKEFKMTTKRVYATVLRYDDETLIGEENIEIWRGDKVKFYHMNKSTVMEPPQPRQVTNTVMETVHEMTTQQVTVQKPVQQQVKRLTQIPQTVNVVHEHEEIVQYERPRMVMRVVHEHAGSGFVARDVHKDADGGIIDNDQAREFV